jgi:hypothetical protein
MKQKRVGDKLYVLDMVPYTITEDTDVSIIYVQQEKLDGYLELNPTLADKISTINYLTFSVRKKDWADDGPGPEPTPKKNPQLDFTNSFLGFNQGDTGNMSGIVSNPNELDYNVSLVRATTGEIYDIADNDYFTVDAEGNYTAHNMYNYDLALVISRAEDDEWLEASSTGNAVIYPTSEEIADQTMNAESTFNDQSDELDMYLTADIISQMDPTGMADLAANLVNYRYVLSVDYYNTDGLMERDAILLPSYNSDSNVMILYAWNTLDILFTISFNDNAVTIGPNINWLNLHKPGSSDFYAVDLDGYSEDGSQSLVLAVPELENNETVWNPAYTHQMEDMKVLMYPTLRGFRVISAEGDYEPVNESGAYDCYVGGGYTYYNDEYDELEIATAAGQAQISLPNYQFGMGYVLMKNRETTGLVLTVDKPQDEAWLGELFIGSDANVNVFVQDIPYIWLKAGNQVSLYLDGAYGQSANKATAVSGIQQSDITDAQFTMPNNDVEVSVRYVPTYMVDLRAQELGEGASDPTDISEVTPTIEAYDTPTPFGNFEGSQNMSYTYVGLYDTGEVDENEDPIYDIYNLDATDIEWTCDIPGVTIEYSDSANSWEITVASGTTLDGTETVSVSIVDGYEVQNVGFLTGSNTYAFNPTLPAN